MSKAARDELVLIAHVGRDDGSIRRLCWPQGEVMIDFASRQLRDLDVPVVTFGITRLTEDRCGHGDLSPRRLSTAIRLEFKGGPVPGMTGADFISAYLVGGGESMMLLPSGLRPGLLFSDGVAHWRKAAENVGLPLEISDLLQAILDDEKAGEIKEWPRYNEKWRARSTEREGMFR